MANATHGVVVNFKGICGFLCVCFEKWGLIANFVVISKLILKKIAFFLAFLVLAFLVFSHVNDANNKQQPSNQDVPTDVTIDASELSGKVLEWYNKVKDGDAAAQYELACCFHDGLDTKKDYKKALYWANKASESGSPEGTFFIAVSYENGEGVAKNDSMANVYYTKAHAQALPLANEGDARAQFVMGELYYLGVGDVYLNYETAFGWYRKAAEQGYARAQCNLGYCYEHGQGVSKDKEKAIELYRKSAEQGYEVAQNNLRNLGLTW